MAHGPTTGFTLSGIVQEPVTHLRRKIDVIEAEIAAMPGIVRLTLFQAA